jgi:glycosyltransferase involved in cell wall biosynthesis
MSVYLSAVVPVFDEVDALPAFHAELLAALERLGRDCELVYVDDGSTDGSTELLHKLAIERPDVVRVLVLRRNFGKSGALAAGLDAARGRLIVTLDADGQDVPAELPTLLAALEGDRLDLVGGWRRTRDDRFTKRVQSRLYNAATRRMTGLHLHDFNTGYKLFRAEVADELPLYGEFHRFVPVLAHDLGFRVGEVPVHHRPRQAGRSKYLSVLRLPKTMLDLLTVLFLTRFADRPLYLFGGVGTGLAAIGFLVLVYLSFIKLAFGAGIGQRPLLLFGVLAVLVGVQLVGTGFIGDVLRHSVSREEKPYRIRETYEAADDETAAERPLESGRGHERRLRSTSRAGAPAERREPEG